MKKILLVLLAISSFGVTSSVFADDCKCEGSAKQCSCPTCECPACD